MPTNIGSYLCGLRISEVVGNTMGNFFCRRDKDGEERWWREIGLPPLPLQGETAPLLLPIGGKSRTMTRGAVHAIVKSVFENTATKFRLRGAEFKGMANRIEQASAHWLRHTAGSHMANSDVDLQHVRDNLVHESISTTSNYLHSSDDKRHTETEQKHRIKW